MNKQRLRLLLGFALSLGLLGWVVWHTEWAELGARLREANPLLLAAAFGAVALGIVLRAWRWSIMLEPEAPARPLGALWDAVNVGYLANNLLPARLGDLLRAYLAAQWTPATLAFALSTTVVERVLDTLVVVGLLFGVLPLLPVPPLAARTGLLVGVGFVLASVALAVAAWQRARSERLIRALLRPLPLDEALWSARIVALLDGFTLLREPGRLARVLLSTALIWAVAIASYWFTFRAFALDGLGVAGAAFTIALAALGMAAPSGPAAAGTFDAAAAGALLLLGVPAGLAGGVAVTLHAINFLTITVLGVYSLLRRGLSLGSLARQAEQAGAEAHP